MGWKSASEEYKAAYSAFIDQQISDNEKNSITKRGITQLSSLISGKLGDTINVTDIAPKLKETLGISGDTFTILSEYERDSLILTIDAMTADSKEA